MNEELFNVEVYEDDPTHFKVYVNQKDQGTFKDTGKVKAYLSGAGIVWDEKVIGGK